MIQFLYVGIIITIIHFVWKNYISLKVEIHNHDTLPKQSSK